VSDELEQFASVVAHDLSEPLRSVAGFAELLRERHGDKLDDEGREFVELIVLGAERMRKLLEGLHDYAKADAAAIVERVDCAEPVQRAIDSLASRIEDMGAGVEVGPLPVVEADGAAFERVVENLLSNALKFSRPGEAPRVRIDAERQSDGWRFRVADHGVGIVPAQRDRAFAIFQQLQPRDAAAGAGIGLGLAVCRKLVGRQGGRIGVEETPGGGCTFWFTVPDRAAPR
jgi:light-regulated signal transduction histidine kinase (bacteriophytochrome)